MEVFFEMFTKYMYWEYDMQSSVLEAEGENKINGRILYQSCRGFQMGGRKQFRQEIMRGTI